MLNFYDFIQVYVFTTNHHLKAILMSTHNVLNKKKREKITVNYP